MSNRQLVGAAEWFAVIAAGAPAPLMLLQDNRVLCANRAAARAFGKEWEFELVGQEWEGLITLDDPEGLRAFVRDRSAENGQLFASVGRVAGGEGLRIADVHAWHGRVDKQLLTVMRVLFEQRLPVAERLERLDREARFHHACLHAILQLNDEAALLQEVCRIAVELGGYLFAWAGFAEDSPGRPIRPVGFSGVTEADFAGLIFSWQEGDPQAGGPSGTALRSGQTCVMRDLQNNPAYAPWRATAEAYGYTSCAAFPLTLKDGARGVISVGDAREDGLQAPEVLFMEQLARSLGFGLDQLRQAQQKAELAEDLRAAREFLAGVLDHAPCPISAAHEDGRLLVVNSAWRELFDYRLPLTEMTRLQDCMDQALAAQLLAANREALKSGQPVALEDFASIGGRSRRISTTRFPIRDAQGRYSAVGGILEDVTERYLAQAALKESEANLRAAEKVANLGHWVLDLQSQAAVWSEGMYSVFGVDRQDAQARTVAYFAERIVHPADRARVLERLAAAAQGQAAFDIRYRAFRRGEEIHIHAKAVLARDALGQPLRLVGTCQDITAEVQAEARLAELNEELAQINEELRVANEDLTAANTRLAEGEERYRCLVESSPEGIALVLDGRIVFANAALARLHGVAGADELVGRAVLSLVPQSQHEAVRKVLAQVSADGAAPPVALARALRADGKELEVEVRFSLLNWQGRLALLCLLRDVSQEASLARQVRQAQKLEALGTLASGIAHDFNNLLFGILGYADLLGENLAGQPQALEDLAELRRAGQRAQDLVQQILVVARKSERRSAPVSVCAVVKEALKLLRPTLPASIEISQRLDGAGLLVEGDPTELHQIVMNLCTNARQAMPAGGRLSLSTRAFEVDADFAGAHHGLAPGPHLLLQVSDSGEGMPPEVLEHIFDPFYTTKEPGEGTGLGLSVVYGIVTGMGGAISVYSKPGQGATFDLYLPLCAGTAQSAALREAPVEAAGGTERILVVDDDPGLLKLVDRSLTRLGYRVTAIADSSVALSAFRAGPDNFDLLYTDYSMPGLNGLQLANGVRSLRPRLPVILATGFVHAGLEDAAVFAGIREVVAKPIPASALGAVIRRALDEVMALG